MINADYIKDAWHLTGYAKGINAKTAYKQKIPYIYHAVAISVEGGRCFLYGLDDHLTSDQFAELKEELQRMSFNEVGRHNIDGVIWEKL
jgi:hypothetical protein